jgi:hypothetical protein
MDAVPIVPPLFWGTKNTTLHELQTGDRSRATDTTEISPLRRSTIILQIPDPVPRGLVVTNASKTTPALLGSMPGPVSSAVRTIASRFMRPVLAGHQQGYRGARTKIVDPKSNFFSPRGWDIRIPRLGVVIRDASRPHGVARQKHTRRLRQVRALKTSDTVSFA